MLKWITRLYRVWPTKRTKRLFEWALARQMADRKRKGIQEIKSGIGAITLQDDE